MEPLFVGKNVIFLPVTDSTNSYAIELLKNVNLMDGTVIYTAEQTGGRGQRGTSWNAEPASNLTISIVLHPGFLRPENQFLLYIISALACYDTTAHILNDSQFDIKIKWPNDILVNRSKLGGILIENRFLGNQLQQSVVGIGMNVNQTDFGDVRAVSFASLLGKKIPIENCMKVLCGFLEKYYLQLKSGKIEQLRELYLSRLFGLDQFLNFEFNQKIQKMKVKGISPAGLLCLENIDRHVVEVDVKDVKWIL